MGSYRIIPGTMGRIISETCQILWTVFSEKGFIKAHDSQVEWLTIIAEFNSKWNFPHCLGATDEKHVLIQAPARSRSISSITINFLSQFYLQFATPTMILL